MHRWRPALQKMKPPGSQTSPSKYESHCTNRKHGKNERRQKIITNSGKFDDDRP